MASDPDRPAEGAWSELERGFFATAPPDVPEPPPEPMRFDDLDPIAPPRPARRVRLSRAWVATAAARSGLGSLTRALAVAARVAVRGGRARVAQLAVALRGRSHDPRLLAAAAAALIVVMSVSAGVVASRGGARTTRAGAQPAVRSGGTLVSAAAPASSAPSPAPAPVTGAEAEATMSSGWIAFEASNAPEPSPPPQRKRKHAKSPARHSASTKAAAKPPADLSARPAFSR